MTGAPAPAAAAPVKQVFLIQNSGWMQPYFVDHAARFPEIVQRLVTLGCRDTGAPAVLAEFNQSTDPARSPQTLYSGTCGAVPARRLAQSLSAAHLPGNSHVFADSDYRQALYRGIRRYAAGKPAVVWMVTNNKNSPNNSAEVKGNDAAFYQLLRQSPEVTRVIAIPLQDPAHSPQFSSNGLILFGIAYGAPAAEVLNTTMDGGAGKRYFGAPAAILKPLNRSAVSFLPGKISGRVASVNLEQGTLVLGLDANSKSSTFAIDGRLRNDFYPYIIGSGSVTATLVINGKQYPIPVKPTALHALPPGQLSSPVSMSFSVPPTPTWSPSVLLGSGRTIAGELHISITNQQLALSEDFQNRIGAILPGAPMPSIFTPDPDVNSSDTAIPLVIRVQYPIWPLLALLGFGALLLGGGGFLILGGGKSRTVTVRAGTKTSQFKMARGSRQSVRDETGATVATIHHGLFGVKLSNVKKDAKVSIINK